MARAPIVIALLVVAVFSVWRFAPFLTEDREVIASTPSPPPVYVSSPATVPGHGVACLDQMPYDSHSEVLQLVVAKAPKSSPALDITLKAKGYRDAVTLPSGYVAGPVEVRVKPPKHSVLGTLCIRNTGAQAILLQGSAEGRTASRPNLTVNGAPVAIRVTTKFHERKPSSLLARTPSVIDHAASFKPLPLWMVWPLAFIVLLGIPALTLVAFAATARAAPAEVADPGATASPVPLPWLAPAARRATPVVRRAYAAVARIPAPWALGILLLLVAAYLFSRAVHSHGFQLDEDAYVYFARFTVEHLPNALWNTTVINRGLQRLEPWLLMFPLSLWKGSIAFPVGHALNVLAFISAGIPAYLIARGFGLAGVWRVLAAFLTLVVPWAVVATTFLSEPLGYPAFCWSVWAIWRAAAMPSARSDALALGLIVVACFARSSMVVLFPLLYLSVALQLLRFGPRRARAALAVHWPLIAFIGVAILMYVLSKAGALPQVGSLTGYYGTSPQGISAAFLNKNWIYVSRVAVGTGFIPIVVGGAWLFARVVRPRDAITYALAVAGLGSIVLVLYSNATAGTDERYIIYLAFPLALATVVAFARREAPWPLVLIAGLLTVRLIWHEGWNAEGGPFGYFIGPAETFYARAVLLRLSVWHPGHDPRSAALVFELLIVAACAFAMTRHRYALRTGVALLLALVLLQAGQTNWVIGRYIDQAVAGPGPGLKQRAWVDEEIWGKGRAGYWSAEAGNTALFGAISIEVQFWNNSLTSVVGVDTPVSVQIPPGDELIVTHANSRTGVVTPEKAAVPPYLVTPADGRSAVYGTKIAQSTYTPLQLIKWKPPLRLRWGIAGAEPDGYLAPGPATVRVYAAPLAQRAGQCLSVDIRTPFGWKGDWRLSTHGWSRREPIKSAGFARVEVPLREIAGKPYQEVKLASLGKPVKLDDGRKATIQLAAVDTKPCGG
jgi:hypothetical protein